jgi:hypothetical protein
MRFWSMVTFMVKWAIATIPAVVILATIGGMVMTMVAAMGGNRH